MNKRYVFWIVVVIVLMVGMFLFGYRSPIKTKDAKQTIITELKKDTTLGSVIENSIYVNPYVSSLETKNGRGKSIYEDVQDFSFVTQKDSITKKYEGWLYIKPKIMGYDILSIEVRK